MTVASTDQYGKMRLYNTTRGRLCPNSTLRYNYEHSNPYCRRARRLAELVT